jgi:uncharacterized DUF497 family protein
MPGQSRFELVEVAPFSEFEWHETKRARNWEIHEIDFEDVKQVFSHPHVAAPSHRSRERRWMAVGLLDDVEVTVVYTLRGGRCRIISARRARHEERRSYHEAISDRSKKGQN